MPQEQERFMLVEINIALGRMKVVNPMIVVKHLVKILVVSKIFKI